MRYFNAFEINSIKFFIVLQSHKYSLSCLLNNLNGAFFFVISLVENIRASVDHLLSTFKLIMPLDELKKIIFKY